MRNFEVYSVAAGGGAGDDVDGTSDTTTIPNAAGGVKPRAILITVSEDTYVLVGVSGETVTTTNGTIVTPESGGIVFDCAGHTAVAYKQVSTGGRICISPLENAG
jgi:hypothetical protein